MNKKEFAQKLSELYNLTEANIAISYDLFFNCLSVDDAVKKYCLSKQRIFQLRKQVEIALGPTYVFESAVKRLLRDSKMPDTDRKRVINAMKLAGFSVG